MSLVTSLMNEYFSNEEPRSVLQNKPSFFQKNELPVSTKQSEWLIDENVCIRQFRFRNERVRAKFCVECIKHTFDSPAQIEIKYSNEHVEVTVISESGYITEVEADAMEEFDYLSKSIRQQTAPKE